MNTNTKINTGMDNKQQKPLDSTEHAMFYSTCCHQYFIQ